MSNKAYSYIRFSSTKQADGDSLRRQTEMLESYVKRKGLLLDDSLSMQDLGVSGWKGDNTATGALSVFLDQCRNGQIPRGAFLIVEHLDRLSRQHVRKALALFFEILDAGVTIVTLSPEREYTPEGSNDSLSLIEPLFLFSAANEKSETLSKRLRSAWSEKRNSRKPMTSWTPAWLRLKNDRSGFELIPDRAEIVRQIVQLAVDGYGDVRLVRKLNDDKVPVISGHGHWTNSYVSKILKTEALIGNYQPGTEQDGRRLLTGETWEDYFPAVISMEQWYLLRAARKSRSSQRGPSGTEVANLFTGILFNARDGQPFQRIVKNCPRLISAAYRNGLAGGDTQSFPYEPFENAFLFGFVNELKLADLYGGNRPQVPADNTANLLAEKSDIADRISEVQKRIQTDSNFTLLFPVLDELQQRSRTVDAAIEDERTRLVQITKESESFSDLQALGKLWEGEHQNRSDLRTRIKGKLRQIVESIWVVIYGKKRSKFKTAELQIFFKAGSFVVMEIRVVASQLHSAELIENSASGKVVFSRNDFRLLLDDVNGKLVRGYVKMREADHLHYSESVSKQKV